MNDFEEAIKTLNLRRQLSVIKGIEPEILMAIPLVDLLEKGKAVPVGTIKTHSDGIKRIKTNEGWRPYKGETHREAKPVVADDDVAANVALQKLLDGGQKNVSMLVDMTGLDRSYVVIQMQKQGINPTANPVNDHALDIKLKKPPVEERWEAYRLFLDMVAGGLTKACIAYGTGGVGKTFNLMQTFKKRNLVEYDMDNPQHASGMPGYDFVKITGKSTPTAMYKALYEHNGKIVVFDDCDSVLKDETSINILKGALDTTGDGSVSYLSGKPIKDSDGEALPQRFKFTGRAVFVSNLTQAQMPQPLRSRSLTIDLTMTGKETMVMLKQIVQKMPFQDHEGNEIKVSPEDRTAAVDFLDSIYDKIDIGDLNARTLGQIALIKKKVSEANVPGLDWKSAATAMLS